MKKTITIEPKLIEMKTLHKNIKIPTFKKDILIKDSKLFSWIDSDFERCGASEPYKGTTAPLTLEVRELTENMIFKQMFTDPENESLTQAQILHFVENNKDKLREDGYSTFFLFKSGENFFVAVVRFGVVGSLEVFVLGFEDDGVWGSSSRRRVVVPETGNSDTSDLPLSPSDSLSLERAIQVVKEAGYKVIKEL